MHKYQHIFLTTLQVPHLGAGYFIRTCVRCQRECIFTQDTIRLTIKCGDKGLFSPYPTITYICSLTPCGKGIHWCNNGVKITTNYWLIELYLHFFCMGCVVMSLSLLQFFDLVGIIGFGRLYVVLLVIQFDAFVSFH